MPGENLVYLIGICQDESCLGSDEGSVMLGRIPIIDSRKNLHPGCLFQFLHRLLLVTGECFCRVNRKGGGIPDLLPDGEEWQQKGEGFS